MLNVEKGLEMAKKTTPQTIIRPALLSVEIASRNLAVRIAKNQQSSIKERQEFSSTLVNDVRTMANASFRKARVGS